MYNIYTYIEKRGEKQNTQVKLLNIKIQAAATFSYATWAICS